MARPCYGRAHADARPQPAGHPRCAARRRQRRARRPAPAAEPVGDEPGAGAPARDDGRSAAGPGRPRPRADAARARTARAGRPAGRGRRGGAAPGRRRSTSSGSSAPSRCAPAKASSRTSGRRSSRASAQRRPACGCASCRSPTRTARRCATAPSIWRPASWARRPARRCGRRRCSATASSAWCATGHPLSRGEITPARYAAGRHIVRLAARPRPRTDRRGLGARSGWSARSPTIVGGFAAALALARDTDLIASVPERHTGKPARRHAQLSAAGRPCRRSRSRCSGIRASMPTRRIAGCAAACATLARRRAQALDRCLIRADRRPTCGKAEEPRCRTIRFTRAI